MFKNTGSGRSRQPNTAATHCSTSRERRITDIQVLANMGDSKVLFTAMEDEKLVKIVEKHPSLYDLNSLDYKDQVIKDNDWTEVAKHLGRSEQDCRKRWRNIRDTHNRRKRKGKGTGASASNKHWALASMLSFLHKEDPKLPSMPNTGRDSTNSNDIDDSDYTGCEDHYDINETVYAVQQSSEHSVFPPGTSPKKRSFERNEILKILPPQRQEDSVDLFFKSIAMSVKKLRPQLIHEAEMGTLELVMKLETRHANRVLHQPTANASK